MPAVGEGKNIVFHAFLSSYILKSGFCLIIAKWEVLVQLSDASLSMTTEKR